MNTEEKTSYFRELTRNLRHEGLSIKPETPDGLLPVELDRMLLCRITDTGGVRYRAEDTADEHRSAALNKVIDIAKITAEYMRQMETAPQLTASSLTGDYRLLAEFNDVVLAGHPTSHGMQFVTWAWVQDHTALYQGDYYGPGAGVESYASAKRDFAVRSGLVLRISLFTPEQLTEIYRSIHETLEDPCPITDEQQKCLRSAAEQIEYSVPDLEERVARSDQVELEQMSAGSPQDGGMQFN